MDDQAPEPSVPPHDRALQRQGPAPVGDCPLRLVWSRGRLLGSHPGPAEPVHRAEAPGGEDDRPTEGADRAVAPGSLYQKEILIAYLDQQGREQLGTWLSTEGLELTLQDPQLYKDQVAAILGGSGRELLSVQVVHHLMSELPLVRSLLSLGACWCSAWSEFSPLAAAVV